MCGIAGFVLDAPGQISGSLVRTLQRRLEHRGPDDQGYLLLSGGAVERARVWEGSDRQGEAVLLHRRLSILDLADTGWQPMGTPDGRYHIVYNGEIYNYLELRAELEATGHRFRSQSDTEVLLAAMAEWGAGALNRLVGMFAFALLDTQKRTLFLARDFFGIKPLYYTFDGPGFAFASEVKALLEIPGVPRTIDAERLYLYLNSGRSDDGGQSILSSVRQLPPAHYLKISLDAPRRGEPTRYWQVDLDARADLSFQDAAARLREMFLESVQLHLRSDVQVGAALSGGIDSSAIVMAMRHLGGSSLDIHTFSYVADEEAISEERWMDLVGRTSGAVVHKTHAQADELFTDLSHLVRVQDVPFGSTSIYAQHRVFRLAHEKGIKVMLDGQGADELLGGYSGYVTARFASLARQGRWVDAMQFMRRASSWPGRRGIWRQGAWRVLPPEWFDQIQRVRGRESGPAAWLNAPWFRERGVDLQPVRSSRSTEQLREELFVTLTETSLPALLRYEDRNSMAYSIESRVPFLTPALASFILSLPEEYIISPDGTTKAVFREAMRGIVPDAVLDRRDKIGFSTPERRWLSGMDGWVETAIGNGVSHEVPALVGPAMREEWQAVRRGERPFDFRFWRWLNLVEWSREVGAAFD
jgi:asparagine synthase (glutamine-hydrolysing)